MKNTFGTILIYLKSLMELLQFKYRVYYYTEYGFG